MVLESLDISNTLLGRATFPDRLLALSTQFGNSFWRSPLLCAATIDFLIFKSSLPFGVSFLLCELYFQMGLSLVLALFLDLDPLLPTFTSPSKSLLQPAFFSLAVSPGFYL